MNQLDLFNAAESEAERIAGMGHAAESRKELLAIARSVALRLARYGRAITADDVVEGLVDAGYDVHCLGNSAGSLFKGGEWKWTGEWRKSRRRHAHANLLRVWKLK